MTLKIIEMTSRILFLLFVLIFAECNKENISEPVFSFTNINFNAISFGELNSGLYRDTVLIIKNPGESKLDIYNISIEGQNANDFSVQNKSYLITILSHDSVAIVIRFNPENTGDKTAQLIINSSSKNLSAKIKVSGISLDKIPNINLSFLSISFDNTLCGLFQEKPIIITNLKMIGKNFGQNVKINRYSYYYTDTHTSSFTIVE
jgi:hypothetical protein